MGETTIMSWYKESFDFTDRNLLIRKVQYLKELRKILQKLSKVVFQSGKTAKDTNNNIIMGKKITSYPSIRDVLIEADSIVLDSPWKFAYLCNEAIYKIDNKIYELEKERKGVGKSEDKVEKGWK